MRSKIAEQTHTGCIAGDAMIRLDRGGTVRDYFEGSTNV